LRACCSAGAAVAFLLFGQREKFFRWALTLLSASCCVFVIAFAPRDTVIEGLTPAIAHLESSGVPGEIQVTRDVYEQLKNDFEMTPRGTIKVKGKGEMETFLLIAKLSA
jgi:Adenylate and Guanylate cyclase catalytic domain